MMKTTKTIIRLLRLFALIIVLLCSTTTTAFASDVKSISLRAVSNGDLKFPTIESRSSKYEVTDVSWNKSEDSLKAGDIATATIVVSPTDDNRIYISKESNIKISGSGVEIASYSRSGTDFKIRIRYTVEGELNSPEEAYWDENSPWIAKWKRVSNADEYQVRLYVGSSRKTTKTTRSTSYNFAEELAKKGIYEKDDVYFSVKAVSDDNDDSSWVDSDYLSDDDWYEIWYYCKSHYIDINGRYDNDDDYDWDGPAYVNTVDGYWTRETDGGWYFYIFDTKQYGWISRPSGRYYCDRNTGRMKTDWNEIDGCWYYFKNDGDDCGRMITGWKQEPNGWFYLDSDGKRVDNGWRYINGNWYYFRYDGLMLSNTWQQINGNWYYFSSSGAALKGWNWINGSCYYFCISQSDEPGLPECAMAYNRYIDGYWVDGSGRWIQ